MTNPPRWRILFVIWEALADICIAPQVFVSSLVVDEIKRIVKESEIMKYGVEPGTTARSRLTQLQGR